MKHFLLLAFLFSTISYSQEIIFSDSVFKSQDLDQKPEFVGGMAKFYQFLSKKYKMPEEQGLEGKIIVEFIVEKDGTLTNLNLMQDVGFGSGEKMLDFLKKCPKWNPGKKDGNIVRSLYSLPVIIRKN